MLTSGPVTFGPTASPSSITFSPASSSQPVALPSFSPPVATFTPQATPATFSPTSAPEDDQTQGPTTGIPGSENSTGAPEHNSTSAPRLSAVDKDSEETVVIPESVTFTTTVGSYVSMATLGMSAASMTTLAMVSMNCQVRGDRDLPLVLHPLQFRVEGSHALGCVIGNTALMVGFYWITYFVYRMTFAVRSFMPTSLPIDLRGFVRFPASAFFIVIWLYQGTALSGIVLLLDAPSTWSWLLGCAVSLFCIILPVWAFHRVIDGTRWRNLARYRYDRSNLQDWVIFIIGPGAWVSTSEEKHWVSRYSSMVLTYRQDTAWWALLEFLGAFAMAAITATPTSDHFGCGHVKLACGIVFAGLLLLELRYAPHVRQRDNYIDPAMLCCECLSMLFAAVAFYVNDPSHWAQLMTQVLVFMATGFIVVKSLLDIFTEMYLLCTGRRDRLQKEEWGLREKMSGFEKGGQGWEGFSQESYETLDDGTAFVKQRQASFASEPTHLPYRPTNGSLAEYTAFADPNYLRKQPSNLSNSAHSSAPSRTEVRKLPLFDFLTTDDRACNYVPTTASKRLDSGSRSRWSELDELPYKNVTTDCRSSGQSRDGLHSLPSTDGRRASPDQAAREMFVRDRLRVADLRASGGSSEPDSSADLRYVPNSGRRLTPDPPAPFAPSGGSNPSFGFSHRNPSLYDGRRGSPDQPARLTPEMQPSESGRFHHSSGSNQSFELGRSSVGSDPKDLGGSFEHNYRRYSASVQQIRELDAVECGPSFADARPPSSSGRRLASPLSPPAAPGLLRSPASDCAQQPSAVSLPLSPNNKAARPSLRRRAPASPAAPLLLPLEVSLKDFRLPEALQTPPPARRGRASRNPSPSFVPLELVSPPVSPGPPPCLSARRRVTSPVSSQSTPGAPPLGTPLGLKRRSGLPSSLLSPASHVGRVRAIVPESSN
ncbi:hypothetical protein DIPPA_23926 [Diplonema papillatum]|nr:hypothetical protein DIPPA_23926 [Diplonema papillatum]